MELTRGARSSSLRREGRPMNALRGEWTKLRSVPRWVVTLLGAAALTVGLSAFGASASSTDINEHPDFVTGPLRRPRGRRLRLRPPDRHRRHVGHRARHVAGARPTPGRARAARTGAPRCRRRRGPTSPRESRSRTGPTPGSSYVSVLLTGSHGVRMQSDFTHDVAGSASTGDRWLRLTRTGGRGHRVRVRRRTDVAADRHHDPECRPGNRRDRAGGVVGPHPLRGPRHGRLIARAGIRRVPSPPSRTWRMTPPSGADWQGTAVAMPLPDDLAETKGRRTADGPTGRSSPERDGTYTVRRARARSARRHPDDDVVEGALIGVIAGLMALICVGALFATSEYRRGMIRTTFAATPRTRPGARGQGDRARRRHLRAQPARRRRLVPRRGADPAGPRHGPAGLPDPVADRPAVLRALVLTALFMTGVTLVALAVGMLVRRSAAAITLTIVSRGPPAGRRHGAARQLAALADVHDSGGRLGDAASQAADRHPRRAVGADRARVGHRGGARLRRRRPRRWPGGSCGGATHDGALASRVDQGAHRAEHRLAAAARRARDGRAWGSRSRRRCESTTAARIRARSTR